MPPQPRRSSGLGKGRGRGGRGSDRRLSDNVNTKTKKRERGSSSTKRPGGGGSSGVSSSSTTACSRPTRAVTTVLKKLVVRNIPPRATEKEARELLQAHGVGHEFVWRFVPGQKRSNNRAPMPARLYLDMKKEPDKARRVIAALHGQFFYPDAKEKGNAKPLDVEFAPFQKIPREKQRKDAKVGTIDRDPEYLSFLEELSKPKDKLPSAEAAVDMAEGETLEKPVAALVKFLNERKTHSRDKIKGKSGGNVIDKSLRRPKGKKEGSKKDKLAPMKDRQKKVPGDASNPQDLKNRKQRKRVSLTKETTKQELLPAEPGMLRIMTPKSGITSAELNGTVHSTDAHSERGSERRVPKSGKKNGGRGRNNANKSKDVTDGTHDESANLKLHQRRKGTTGCKEPHAQGKKKVFAPKDSTAQGAPSKS